MQHVILIHAHKDPAQVNQLVRLLACPHFVIYVNLDARSGIDPAVIAAPARVVSRRIPVHWGDFSQVRAILNSLAEIAAAVPRFGKVVFISGQDFPLLPNDALKAALDGAHGSELIECVPLGPGGWACEERFQFFHLPRSGPLAARACRLAARAMRVAGLRRRMPGTLRPYGGSSWWTLSRPCIAMILARERAEPRLARFFRTTACPDEMFFQTLVMDSPFRERVVSDNFRYIAWPGSGARNPRVLGPGDFDSIARSTAHFCRKVDAADSAALLPLLVRLREQRSRLVPPHD